uniref:Uncharacterized protein n=1 Tax=Erpetoichthys calabaricus TaxID=27687 RepID=A0A8C4RQL5_ERPCA
MFAAPSPLGGQDETHLKSSATEPNVKKHTKKFIHHQSARYITQPQGIRRRRRRIQPVISIITLVMITIKLVLPTGFRKFLVHNIKELEIANNCIHFLYPCPLLICISLIKETLYLL